MRVKPVRGQGSGFREIAALEGAEYFMRSIRVVLSWLLVLFLVGVVLQWTVHPWPDPPVGQVIFFDLPGEHVLFHRLAMTSGFDLFEPTGRYIFGVIELIAAFCLLIFPFRRTGAGVLSVLFLILIGLHLSPWLGMELPLSGDGKLNDGGSSFYLTVAGLTAGLLLLVIHPKS